MDVLYLVFALVSIVFMTDGMLLKTEKFQKLIAQLIKKQDAAGIVSLVSTLLVTTGAVGLIWSAVGYLLSEQVSVEVFILIYVVLLIIPGVFLAKTLRRYY